MSPGDEITQPPAMARSDRDGARAFTVCRADQRLPDALAGAVAAIGNFDGVHRGHRALIESVRNDAARASCPGVVLTFEPHPRSFFAPDRSMFRLTSPEAKEIVFAHLGLDGLITRRFDKHLADTNAEDFVRLLLKRELRLRGVVIGHDFHFGRGREGNPQRLAALCEETDLDCRIVSAVSLEGSGQAGDVPVSSSAIRAALGAGDIHAANALLGYRWFVLGVVQHGDKRGRELGYPTANLRIDSCGLAHGIYAVRVRLADGAMRNGVASYGRRPTFDNGASLLEINVFDFSDNLYDQRLAVEFVGHIRSEERFNSADALIARMHVDAAEARVILLSDTAPSVLG